MTASMVIAMCIGLLPAGVAFALQLRERRRRDRAWAAWCDAFCRHLDSPDWPDGAPAPRWADYKERP